MKKILILLLFVMVALPIASACIDSDGGLNYYKRGSLSGICKEPATCGVWVDSCKDNETLYEYTCDNLNGVEYECPKGCTDGACIKKNDSNNPECKNLYWFDNEHQECSQKEFCGLYMYLGLQTFESKTQCEKALNVTNECVTDDDCPQLDCIGEEDCIGIDVKCINGKCKNLYWCIERPETCTAEYAPVCGCYIIRCEIPPCSEECKTYGNSCTACSENADYWIDGECKEKISKNCPNNSNEENNKCYKTLSNGRKAEIKIMPETASARAIERLGELGFTIELKEVGKGDEAKPVYELEGEKQGKMLGLFKIKGKIKAYVDAETGNVKVIKPWWSFLAFGLDKKDSGSKIDDSGSTVEGIKSVVTANNQFAFELYSEYKSKEGNIFFSPYSISTALAMTYEGARGKTAEEIQSVFHFPEENVRRPAFAKLYNEINKKDKKYQLNTANALWAQKDFQFLSEYFNIVEKYYGGKVTNLDFVGETEKSRLTINKWVEEQTNNKIKDLIPLGILDSMTKLVLTNAIYFKGTWVYQFDKKDTKELDFKVTSENIVKVPMMYLNNEEAKFNYAETNNLQVLEMLYKGEELSMLILLPKDNLGSLEKNLDAKKIEEYRNMLKAEYIEAIYLPKFKFETKYFMADTLKEMGMPTVFSDSADFSGMTGKRDLFISQVIHQAFVEVNEEGTEAAAATAVIMEKGISVGPRTPVFRADHPFIFIIQEKATGNILFLGRVINPNK